MIKKILSLILFLFICTNLAIAEPDVVYPKSKNTSVNASSVFIFGSVEENSKLYINSSPVKLYENKFFVEVIPLTLGKNNIVLTSEKNGKKSESVYTVTSQRSSSSTSKQPVFVPFPKDTAYYSKTIKDNSTVREKPSTASTRISELQKNIVLYLSGKQGDYYKIDENNGTFWIHKSNISEPVAVSKRTEAVLKKQIHKSEKNKDIYKFYLSHPVMYKLSADKNNINLTLYGVKPKDNPSASNTDITFNFKTPIMGYEGYYEENTFIFQAVKNPEIPDLSHPLKGIKIFVDAGHGGDEKGAVGPTRVCEKDINLSISRKLIKLLKDEGAIVSYSRIDDRKVSLYDRVKAAKGNDALISISIHNNSLPPGKNPYIYHGTEVHYYNENAKRLSEIINNNLACDLNLKKNGIHKSSFALNRSTNPVSVLVEVAYMINPEEYILLKNVNFHQKAAESVLKSLKEYVNEIKKQM